LAYTLVAIALHGLTTDEQKLRIRAAIMWRQMESEAFRLPPDTLASIGFKNYRPEDFNRFKNEHYSFLTGYLGHRRQANNSSEFIKSLVLTFSKHGIEGGCGQISDDLLENIKWVTSGHGCCSDHSQTFLALALLNGINAREVHNLHHTFNEYWDSTARRWIWVDPMFTLLARDDHGDYLGLRQIQQRLQLGQKIDWELFGTPSQAFRNEEVANHPLFQWEAFQTVGMTLGNNVFQEDRWNERLGFMPRSFRQLALYVVGVKPGYGYFDASPKSGISRAYLMPLRIAFSVYGLVNLLLVLLPLTYMERFRACSLRRPLPVALPPDSA
jgi:hypothetical protein